jgi:hypothetical protein
MSKMNCQVCQNIIPSADSGRYCYLHRQVYDSLISEFDAVKKTSNGAGLDWKEFLAEKVSSVRYLPKELGDVIKIEREYVALVVLIFYLARIRRGLSYSFVQD